jgi:radical SAM protein with 4Fe4S-binding SPASM domain
LRPPDPYQFAIRVMEARQVALRHGVGAVYAATDADRPRISFCPVGNDALILHPDRSVTACYLPRPEWQERGLDLDLGSFRDGMELHPEAVSRVRRLAAEKPGCRGCFCRWSCAGGCHVKHTAAGLSGCRDEFCIQTRLIAACTLLESVEQRALAGALLASRSAMERLGLWPCDLLEDGGA